MLLECRKNFQAPFDVYPCRMKKMKKCKKDKILKDLYLQAF
jgi:hypothetical protein